MQYLTMPFAKNKVSADYKNAYYKSQWGCVHYGSDLVSANKDDIKIYALGDGEVKLCGCDGPNGDTSKGCGNVIVIVYKDCVLKNGKHTDLTVTYMHLEAIYCKKGDKVKRGDLVALEGNTGGMTSGRHLHIQCDVDTKYFQYCSGLSAKGHALLKKGTTDSTIDPVEALWLGKGQTLSTTASAWYDKTRWAKVVAVPTNRTYEVRNSIGTLLAQFGTKREAEAYIKGMTINEV